jgi:HEAT repeat protein
MSSRRKQTLLVLISLVAAALLVPQVLRIINLSREPRYAGRPLSFWVLALEPMSIGAQPSPPSAVRAIQHIGTNALPFALKWTQGGEPGQWRVRVAEFISKISPTLTALGEHIVDNVNLANNTPELFAILGDRATPAIPELWRLANDTNAPQTAFRALMCLAGVGTNALPQILAIMLNPKHPRQQDAGAAAIFTSAENSNQLFLVESLMAASQIAPSQDARFPTALVQGLTNANPDIRQKAANAILQSAPELLNTAPPRRPYPRASTP